MKSVQSTSANSDTDSETFRCAGKGDNFRFAYGSFSCFGGPGYLEAIQRLASNSNDHAVPLEQTAPAGAPPTALNSQAGWATAINNFLGRTKEFLGALATCNEPTVQRAPNLVSSYSVTLSSLTTPNGPWVYTAVPWED